MHYGSLTPVAAWACAVCALVDGMSVRVRLGTMREFTVHRILFIALCLIHGRYTSTWRKRVTLIVAQGLPGRWRTVEWRKVP
jgi:hypothetical protein